MGEAAVAAKKGEKRQAEILRAARRVLVKDGYDRLVLREVAARVGVTLGNLQYYFATRDDLLEAVVRAELADNRRDIARLAGAGGPANGRLAAITRHLIDAWAHDGGRIYAVMLLLALHHRRFRDLHREIYSAFYEDLATVLAELQPRRGRAELLRRARLITTIMDGALVQIPMRGFADDAVAAVQRIAEAPLR